MDYDLIAVCTHNRRWLVLRHPLLFDHLMELYKKIDDNVRVHQIGESKVTMSEYISIKETLGSEMFEIDELREKCSLILQYVRTFKKSADGVFKLNDSFRNLGVHVIYMDGVSFVTEKGLHICQFYGDFQYVDSIDLSLSALANEFFNGKKWENRTVLCQKVNAFKILFCT